MTEGMAHLYETYKAAGIKVNEPSNPRVRGWAYRYGTAPHNGYRVTMRYAILSAVERGRALVMRWDWTTSQGEHVEARSALATMVRMDRFDRVEAVR